MLGLEHTSYPNLLFAALNYLPEEQANCLSSFVKTHATEENL